MKRTFSKGVLILGLCVIWTSLLHCAKDGKPPVQASAPHFSLKTLDDKEIALSKLKGKVVLLDFWATWCAPCRESIPHLVQLHKTFQEKGLEVIGMNTDRGNIDAIRRFVKSMDIPYSIVITPDEVEKNYGVTGLPTTILIDKSGRIRQRFMGFTSEISKQMTATVTELTSEKP